MFSSNLKLTLMFGELPWSPSKGITAIRGYHLIFSPPSRQRNQESITPAVVLLEMQLSIREQFARRGQAPDRRNWVIPINDSQSAKTL